MTLYARIDVNLPKSKRIRKAGYVAELLFIRGILFAKEMATDGELDATQLPLVGLGLPSPMARAVDRLVSCGLWEVTPDGWRVPPDKWREWQSTAEEIEANRRRKAEAGRLGAKRRWENAAAKGDGTDGKQIAGAIMAPMAGAIPHEMANDGDSIWRVEGEQMERERETDTPPTPSVGSNGCQGPPESADRVTPSDRYTHREFTERIWSSLPANRRKSKPKIEDEAIAALGRGADPNLVERRIVAYYASPVGVTRFARAPARWLSEDGWTEPDEAWQNDEPTEVPKPRKKF